MKTIKLENQSIEISDESFEQLKKSFIKEARWVPEKKEEYWNVNNMGEIGTSTFVNDSFDYFRLGQNNVFKTEEEAEAHAKKLQAISKITNYCWENGLAKKWVYKEENWYLYWNRSELWGGLLEYQKDSQVLPYLKSEEACGEVIEKFEDELKLIFEV